MRWGFGVERKKVNKFPQSPSKAIEQLEDLLVLGFSGVESACGPVERCRIQDYWTGSSSPAVANLYVLGQDT